MNIEIKAPSNGKVLYNIQLPTNEEIFATVKNAREFHLMLVQTTIEQRIEDVYRLRNYIIDNREDIIDALIAENGKTRLDALTSEIFEICDFIDVYCSKLKKWMKDVSIETPLVLMGKKSKIFIEPMGVILVITPWNYPLYQCIVPAISSFLAGNCTVVKPSELTCLKPIFDKIFSDTRMMKDAVKLVYGDGATAQMLIAQKPDKIHFTGSTATGKKIMQFAAQWLIPVDLELGGKDPAVVFNDVNLERTVNGILWGAFTNAGQSCTSIERCYVHESIFSDFVDMLVKKAKKLKSGEEIQKIPSIDIGLITSGAQMKIIKAHLEDAVANGAIIHCGGFSSENCLQPVILTGVNHTMKIMTEETFGAVLPVMKFKDEKEVITWCNESEYGLSASVWSKDMKRAERVARAIKTGNVSINNHMLTEANPNLPFGGIKNSGFGKLKGKQGFYTFCNLKSIIIDEQKSAIEPHWYPYTPEKYNLITDVLLSHFSKSKNWLKFALTGLKLEKIGNKQKL